MLSDPFNLVDEVSKVLPTTKWILVGGLMVHAHALIADVGNNRPTTDADIVVEVVSADSYHAAARAIESIGFEPYEPTMGSA